MWEYLAFGGSLVSLYLYGKPGIKGPIAGVLTAALFMAFGYFEAVYAAIVSNIVFLVLHIKNLRSAIMADDKKRMTQLAKAGNTIQREAHKASAEAGWWTDLDSGEMLDVESLVPTKLMLIVSEIAEGMEGHRKSKMDDHLPHRSMLEVELADAVIRIGDLAGALGLDLGGAIAEKMAYNAARPDHKIENRQKAEGKKY